MTDIHPILTLADLFKRQEKGLRDVLTGKVAGGDWGYAFCDDAANTCSQFAPLVRDAQFVADLRKCQRLGMKKLHIGVLADRVEACLTYDGRAWKVGVHEADLLGSDIVEAIRRSFQGFHHTGE